jgi:hypothetical protein
MYKISKMVFTLFSSAFLMKRLLMGSVDLAMPKKHQGRSELYQDFIKRALNIKRAFSWAVKSGDGHRFE